MVKPREKRVPIMMSEEEMTAIDDWRFANRVATRSDAIRRLCLLGIAHERYRDELFRVARKAFDRQEEVVLPMLDPCVPGEVLTGDAMKLSDLLMDTIKDMYDLLARMNLDGVNARTSKDIDEAFAGAEEIDNVFAEYKNTADKLAALHKFELALRRERNGTDRD